MAKYLNLFSLKGVIVSVCNTSCQKDHLLLTHSLAFSSALFMFLLFFYFGFFSSLFLKAGLFLAK